MWFSRANNEVVLADPGEEMALQQIMISRTGPLVDLSSLPSGTYLLKMEGADGRYVSSKLVIFKA